MDTLLDLLAGYRLTRVVIEDSMDFPPLMSARVKAEKALAGTGWFDVLDCPWCASWWVGLGILVARRCAPSVWRSFRLPLAISAAAGLIRQKEMAAQAATLADNAYAFSLNNN